MVSSRYPTRGAVEIDVQVLAIARAELLRGTDDGAFLAVAQEDAALAGPHDDAAVDAGIDLHRRAVVQQEDVAVVAVLDEELLAVDASRELGQERRRLDVGEDEVLALERRVPAKARC